MTGSALISDIEETGSRPPLENKVSDQSIVPALALMACISPEENGTKIIPS